MLATLETGCDLHDANLFQETPEEATLRTGPTREHLQLARNIFKKMAMISAPHDGVAKSDVVRVMRGDFKIFEKAR